MHIAHIKSNGLGCIPCVPPVPATEWWLVRDVAPERPADGLDVMPDVEPEVLFDVAAECLSTDEVDPHDVPMCDRCGRLCDVLTCGDRWACSHCDPLADHRRQVTQQLLQKAEAIRVRT